MKKVVFTEDARAFTTYNLKPQMRTLGPKYGKLLGSIGAAPARHWTATRWWTPSARGETRDL